MAVTETAGKPGMGIDIDIDLQSILRTFSAECEERIAEMEQAIVAMESHPGDRGLLETIFRNAHTIKGNAASLAMTAVAEFTHGLETFLQRLRMGTAPTCQNAVTLLLHSADALRQMLHGAVAGDERLKPEHAALLAALAADDGSSSQGRSAEAADDASERTAAAQKQEQGGAEAGRSDTIRVAIQKLDRMLNLAGEITIAQGRLRQVLEDRLDACPEALEAQAHLERLCLDLQEQIMTVRMVPVGPIFRLYSRMVRDIAVAVGKEARLVIEGEDAEIDLSVIEHLKDPLTHMIRNAIDHGIETPEKRSSEGKDRCGLLLLKAFHESGSIVIQLIDDGAGLNRERIISQARAQGLLAEPERLPDHMLYRVIFEPGFSTAKTVTGLSGRGVGMDVVRRNIEALRGSLAVDSQSGEGTKISIRLPLTLAIIEGFAVGVDDDTFILPLHSVLECLTVPPEEQARSAGQGIINLRGEPLPYVRLRQWLGREEAAPGRESIVVVAAEQMKAGFAVDALYGPRQTVIKPLGRHFSELPGIAGSAILGNGRVALILDVSGLLRDVVQGSSKLGTEPSQEEFFRSATSLPTPH
jgi:two-component system chemotaxis sensor kinase CheA